jgi:hypothetical protein
MVFSLEASPFNTTTPHPTQVKSPLSISPLLTTHPSQPETYTTPTKHHSTAHLHPHHHHHHQPRCAPDTTPSSSAASTSGSIQAYPTSVARMRRGWGCRRESVRNLAGCESTRFVGSVRRVVGCITKVQRFEVTEVWIWENVHVCAWVVDVSCILCFPRNC